MIKWAVYAMVYAGSLLMVINITGFIRFFRYIAAMKTWKKNNLILRLPILLLIFFLLGYLGVGFFGKPDILIAGILFGGSVFVYVMYRMLKSITEQVVENEHLEAELLAAEESSRERNAFLASISHEMRTPMNIILGISGLALRNKTLQPECKEQIVKIDHSARYLSGLINSILDMQRIEAGDFVLCEAPFNLAGMLTQLSTIARTLCEEKGLDYEISVSDDLNRDYTGDAYQLNRALLCIVDNAVKYTDAPGSVKILAGKLESGEKTDTVSFRIADTGIGMEKAFLAKIFEPFAQENPSLTSRYSGSGIGLAIANSIIVHMGGSIKAESEKNKGSIFTVTVALPPLQEDPKNGKTGEDIKKEAGEGFKETPEENLEGRRILIVEDVDENAEIVSDLLELEGAVSERAENGKNALGIFEKSPENYYDAILMDLRMPIMDGLEAAKKIRGLKRGDAGNVPIIALTANASENDIRNTLEAGMNEHLVKPVDADKLYASLRHWIGERKRGDNSL